VRLGELFSYFTGIALVFAYMGLLGLAAFLASRRTKEIGVRKVLGASLSDILRLLSKDFLRLVGVAFIVGAPMAAIAMHRWLEDYVYRISLGWETFVIAGGAVLLLAWLSVSYQSMRAALINPVQSLRHK
jgi:putative ABC transport system permease protein